MPHPYRIVRTPVIPPLLLVFHVLINDIVFSVLPTWQRLCFWSGSGILLWSSGKQIIYVVNKIFISNHSLSKSCDIFTEYKLLKAWIQTKKWNPEILNAAKITHTERACHWVKLALTKWQTTNRQPFNQEQWKRGAFVLDASRAYVRFYNKLSDSHIE